MIIRDGRAKLTTKEYAQEAIWSSEKVFKLLDGKTPERMMREKIEDLAWTVECLKQAFEEEANG